VGWGERLQDCLSAIPLAVVTVGLQMHSTIALISHSNASPACMLMRRLGYAVSPLAVHSSTDRMLVAPNLPLDGGRCV
jgi:hypothetical protein